MTTPNAGPEARASDALAATARLRLSAVLAERRDEEGSYARLEAAIRRVIGQAPGDPSPPRGAPRFLDRRKLADIVNHDPGLVLSIGELRALDQYLEPFGEGLAYQPLFDKPEVLRRIAEHGQVEFLLGSKPDPVDHYRINISHHDVIALNRINTELLDLSRRCRVEIHEVRIRERLEEARADLADQRLEDFFHDRGPSLISLGSARANPLCEWMLCRMRGIAELTPLAPDAARGLPFQFVWPPDRPFVLPSAFHLDPHEAAREDESVREALFERRAACFRTPEGYLIDELSREDSPEGSTYALCAVQRRARNQIWLLVAGLTGPATRAAAHWVQRMPTELDRPGRGRASPVFWALVRAPATRVRERTDESYQVGEAQVVCSGEWG